MLHGLESADWHFPVSLHTHNEYYLGIFRPTRRTRSGDESFKGRPSWTSYAKGAKIVLRDLSYTLFGLFITACRFN